MEKRRFIHAKSVEIESVPHESWVSSLKKLQKVIFYKKIFILSPDFFLIMLRPKKSN